MASANPFDNNSKMSLHERFTYLRKNESRIATTEGRVTDQLALSKSRRLAIQLERRQNLPTAPIRRRPQPRVLAIRERLSLPRAFIARRRGAGRVGYVNLTWKSPLLRNNRRGKSPAVGNSLLNRGRSRSPFSPRDARQRSVSRNRSLPRNRSRSRNRSVSRNPSISRSRSISRNRSVSVPRSINIAPMQRSGSPFPTRFRGGNQYYSRRGRGGRFRGGKRGDGSHYVGRSRGFGSFRGIGRGGRRGGRIGRGGRGGRFRGRGSFRSRGSGSGGRFGFNRRGGREPVPTKEQLDQEMDQYMATNRPGFEKDGNNDTFMQDEESCD